MFKAKSGMLFVIVVLTMIFAFQALGQYKKEYVNTELGFSISYPGDYDTWPAPSKSFVLNARPNSNYNLPFLLVYVADSATFDEAIKKAMSDYGASKLELLQVKETTTTSGDKASIVQGEFLSKGYYMDAIILGVQKDKQWIVVAMSTYDVAVPFKKEEFTDIAKSLKFKK